MTRLEAIDPYTFGTEQQCFGCGPHNPVGLQLTFFRDGDEVVTRFQAREGWQGPPAILHGGLQATLADELAAWTVVALKRRFGFTTSMQLRYYRPARMAVEVEGRASLAEHDERSAVVKVTLRQDGKRLLAGTVSFVIPTVRMAEKMLGGPIPEAWRPLARPDTQ